MRAVFLPPALRASARVWSFVSFVLFAWFACIVRVVCRLRGVNCVAVLCLACFLRMVVASRAVFSMLCGLQGVFVFHLLAHLLRCCCDAGFGCVIRVFVRLWRRCC